MQGNEIIPKLAKEYGFKTLVGAWLGEETDKNEEELQGLIALASAYYVDVAAVGNEVMYREELEEEELIEYILRAKQSSKEYRWATSTRITNSRIVRRLPRYAM